MTDQLLLTEREAARRLMISPRTLHDLRKAGRIRYVQITARKICYRPEDCDEYVASCLRIAPARQEAVPRSKRGRGRAAPGGVIVPFSQRSRGSG